MKIKSLVSIVARSENSKDRRLAIRNSWSLSEMEKRRQDAISMPTADCQTRPGYESNRSGIIFLRIQTITNHCCSSDATLGIGAWQRNNSTPCLNFG